VTRIIFDFFQNKKAAGHDGAAALKKMEEFT
jgi:hypothetical protein